MKNYLSYGGGVNSTAMLLMLHDEGWEFESIYVDHGCDWPETREYVKMMAERYPITILETPENLYEYAWKYKMTPYMKTRWCTRIFKIEVIEKYISPPCFQLIGFSVDEIHRAKMSCSVGVENRWPLLEYEIDREGCKEIIENHRLPVPIKSGCFICPYQRIKQWKDLRRNHPDLFCKAEQLENRNIDYRKSKGEKPFYIHSSKKPLRDVVKENQSHLFEEMKYPPCNCGL